ncbi:structure-specific endonuclease subunit SLX4 [Colossoma macropomum]|uniref:structure-specific endonuclease subunit SLX4 n=1 Tax=Colossoma macropomum TaxID=42526 RepID=UPI001864F4E9|nr:structure-specific endonuclease subunit SLX4 [Colossoma macropomum]
MDDSDQDFSDLCSRLLKRVKRKDSGDEKKSTAVKDEEGSGSSQSKAPAKRRKKNGQLRIEAAAVTGRGQLRIEAAFTGRSQPGCPASSPGASSPGASSPLSVKEKVLRRMERFRRASPPRLLHVEKGETQGSRCDPAPLPSQEPVEEPESDETLALRLQQQLDREAETQAVVDLEDGGLFFCQLCHKDLSAMSPQLRTQHINRCLDESEKNASAPPAPPPPPPPPPPSRPRVPECPLCGRSFKSEKSRSTHLKRCSTAMGVSPAELLQALQRQAAQSLSDAAADQPHQSVDSRGTNASESSMPVKKKARRKGPCMDEDTMVALALSRSLLEQEKERKRELEEERQIQAQLLNPPEATAPVLQWKPGGAKGRGRRRKGVPAAPPPLLLVQDPQTALNRIQQRVSSLLLCPRPPTPPTPKLLPSELPMWTHSAPLWLKSALPGGGPDSVSEFYTPELGEFIQPWVRAEKKPPLSSEVTPGKQHPASASETAAVPEQSSCAPVSLDPRQADHAATPACLTPAMSTPGSQALQDLVELAEEGMTLTQYRHTDKEAAVAELPLSGFVPETTKAVKPHTSSVTVSKLCSDLASMVNNPQLSDVQLQVDSGDVYFAHSFMLYTRCPLLASMVHNAGFGVQEDGMPAAQRVLLGDVPGEAVYALLQYLYTALCPITRTLLPNILQLATRFELSELQQQCEQYSGDPEDSDEEGCSAQEPNPGPQESLAETQFLELLRSMWQHEESDGEDFGRAGGAKGGVDEEEEGGGSGDGEMKEDRVDEEELDEIYEFAATQRKMETTRSPNVSDEEEEEGEEEVNESPGAGKSDTEKQNVEAGQRQETHGAFFKEANTSRHSYRLGEDKDAAAMVTSAMNMHHAQGSQADVCLDSKSNTHGDLNRSPNVSLDRSYNHLFSETWGEYVEASQTPAVMSQLQQAQQKSMSTPRRKSLVSEVIDLSISPPPGSEVAGVSSLPVAGVSPGEGAVFKRSSNAVLPPSPSTLNSIQPQLSSPVPLGPSGRSKHSSPGLSKTRPGLSFPLASSTKPEHLSRPRPVAFSNRLSATSSKNKPELSPLIASSIKPELSSPVAICNQPELIVLSDSSDDMDSHPHLDKVSTPSPSPSPPRFSQNYTQIKAKEGMEVGLPSKKSDERGCSKTDQSKGALNGPDHQSMLDGSAEVSWLIPATPEVSTRSSSTQTRSSMRRTQLFPKSCSLSSSSVPDSSEADTHSGSLRERPACSRPCPDQCSSRDGSTSDVLEHSPVFQKPTSRSKLQTDASQFAKQTHRSPLPVSMPSSSTPVHSTPCPKPPEPLGSPLLKECRLRPQSTASWEEDDDFATGTSPSVSQRVAPARTPSRLKVTGDKDKSVISPVCLKKHIRPQSTASWEEDDDFETGTSPSVSQRVAPAKTPSQLKVTGDKDKSVISPVCLKKHIRPQSTASWEEDDDFETGTSPVSQRVAPAKTASQLKVTGLGSIHLSQSEKLPPQHRNSESREEASLSPPGEPEHAETERDITGETGKRDEEEKGTVEEENRSVNEVEMAGEASFYAFDEPPIAFDDSWGLGGGGVGDQGPCLSLRLESSGDPDSTLEHRGQRETATPHSRSPSGQETHATSRISVAAVNHSLPDPAAWDSWREDDDDDEDEDGHALPLSERVGAVAPPKRVAQLKTPVARKKNNQVPLVPITPMPGFSDMDTPELKKRLDRFGVRPLPKKQMVLKLKEIHQYTHQLMTSESEEETSPVSRPRAGRPPMASTLQPALLSFKQPTAPPPVSPRKLQFGSEDHDVLPTSQDSNTSSTAESERSNPELCDSDDDGSDSEGITASQAAVREKDKLLAVRSFIQSDPVLYGHVLQYQPLSLSELKARLRTAGIRLGTAKLLDFLDSQCITFTTAKPGHPAPSRRKARTRAPAAGPGRAGGRGKRRMAKPAD